MESYRRRKRDEQKLVIDKLFTLADAMLSRFLPLLDEKAKELHPWDMYPELFAEEKQKYDQDQEEDEFERFKVRRRRFAQEHNQKMAEAGEEV